MKQKASFLFIIFFLSIIYLPFIGLFLSSKENTIEENRNKAVLPKLIINNTLNKKFSNEFEAWVNDSYGFRNILIDINHFIHLNIFKISYFNKVLIGKDNWLFHKERTKGWLNYKNNDFTEIKVKRLLNKLLTMKKYFERNNIDFYITMPPGKAIIYPEKLPKYINTQRIISKIDILKPYLNKYSISIIDIRETLIDKKSKYLLYSPTDTHWNDLGAYWGYRSLIEEISKNYNIGIISENDFTINKKKSNIVNGDLARMIKLKKEKSYIFDDINIKFNNITNLKSRFSKTINFQEFYYMEILILSNYPNI